MLNPRIRRLLPVLLVLAGCQNQTAHVYTRETFELDSPYQLFTLEPPAVACESARRALLGQGYIIETASGEQVIGQKAFRASADETTMLRMNIVCTERGEGATVFANAVETLYAVKRTAQSASVGVPVIGSISLPLTGSTDSLVKVGDATVEDKAFYQRFFAVVDYYLEQVSAGRKAERQAETIAPIAPQSPQASPVEIRSPTESQPGEGRSAGPEASLPVEPTAAPQSAGTPPMTQ